ncbi:hypothetical protein LPJ81_006015, partial [Coemansia sp. IMI 209127]
DGGDAEAPSSTPPAPPPQQKQQQQQPSSQKPSGGSRFSLPFRRNSHERGSNQSDAAGSSNQSRPSPKAPPPPPRVQGSSGAPAIPARRPSDAESNAAAPIARQLSSAPPISTQPSRPASSVSGKKAPPLPTSRKPQIMPKPAGLSGSRASLQSSPAPGTSSASDMRGSLRQFAPSPQGTSQSTPINGRSSVDDSGPDSGVVQESQGSVSSLAGMFGQSIRSKAPGQSRPSVSSMTTSAAPAVPPPPPPHVSTGALSNGSAHRRTSSGLTAPAHPPPPPPPSQAPPLSQPAHGRTNGTSPIQNVPTREGKWTFHPPPHFTSPPGGKIPSHKYPSGNRTGSTIDFSI